jgi:hypothetical protein
MHEERETGALRPGHGNCREALLHRVKNQPSRVVGSAPLFPACYLQGKLQLERVSRQRTAPGPAAGFSDEPRAVLILRSAPA